MLFNDNGTKLLRGAEQLQAHVDQLPLVTKEPIWWGEKPSRSFGHAAIVTHDKKYLGDCSKDYQLVQMQSAYDPLIATLKGHDFVAKPFSSDHGGVQGYLIRLDDIQHTFPGRSKPTVATMRVYNGVLPGAALNVNYGIYELLCSNGMHVGAMDSVQIAHVDDIKSKLKEYESVMELAPRVMQVYGSFLNALPKTRLTVEEVTGWLVGAGFPVRDVISAINETHSHLFGEQQDMFREVSWTPRTLLDVATHIVSNPPAKKDGDERTISANTQWAKLATVDRSIRNGASITRVTEKGLRQIRSSEEGSAMREQLLPLVRA